MGDQAVHTETVASFDLDRNEVTVAAYKACWSAGRCTLPDTPGLCNWGRDDRGDHPINCVDWYQARGYCEWLGKRLPTETEWEYAAKGSQGRKYAWGDSEPGGQLCWKRGNARLGTCAVASYLQGNTPQGLRDMGGNVWEWTSSEACPIPQKACGAAARVFRGGGWGNDDAGFVRATSRGVDLPTSRLDFVGFRCARARP